MTDHGCGCVIGGRILRTIEGVLICGGGDTASHPTFFGGGGGARIDKVVEQC
jgi:hypothetical protein